MDCQFKKIPRMKGSPMFTALVLNIALVLLSAGLPSIVAICHNTGKCPLDLEILRVVFIWANFANIVLIPVTIIHAMFWYGWVRQAKFD